MSFLLPKTLIDHLTKKVVSATHEEVICEESFKQSVEGGSCWSVSGQTLEPLCTVHGDSGERQGDWEEFTSGPEELQTGILKSDYELQKVAQSGNLRTKPGYSEDQQVWEDDFVDELVCKLVSQSCFFPESSATCAPERGFKEVSQQDDALNQDLQTSDPCLGGEHVVSPDYNLEALPPYVEESEGLLSQGLQEVAVLRTEYSDASAKLKSAIRGGYEKSGLGPRPKVRVTWAPDVYDPPCTSTSHTSSKNRRRHHHPKSDHKNRHKGKGSSHTDSQKKSQKRMLRRLRHAETFVSGPTVLSQREIQNNTWTLKEYTGPSLDDLTLKSARVSPFILPLKGCFLNPVLSFGEKELVTLDKIQGCHPRHVQTHKLFF